MEHKPSNGQIKELLLNDLLKYFITPQFSIGTGVVVDSAGHQSNQTDIIIYDNRVLPQIVNLNNLGVYPIESVLGVIEVKSNLSKNAISSTNTKFSKLLKDLHYHNKIVEKLEKNEENGFYIYKGIIGFNKFNIKSLCNAYDKSWINSLDNIDGICHVSKYSWIKWKNSREWKFCNHNELTFEETKRFIAWMLDGARKESIFRQSIFNKYANISWLSSYIRNFEDVI